MATEPANLADLAKYECKPKNFNPNRLIAFLPGWTFTEAHLGNRFCRWIFEEPSFNLQLCFENREESNDYRAILQRVKQTTDRYGNAIIYPIIKLEIADLRLIRAETKPGKHNYLSLQNPCRSLHLTNDLTGSLDWPEYDISVFEGQNLQFVPFWKSLLLDLFRLQYTEPTDRSVRIGIGRLYGD